PAPGYARCSSLRPDPHCLLSLDATQIRVNRCPKMMRTIPMNRDGHGPLTEPAIRGLLRLNLAIVASVIFREPVTTVCIAFDARLRRDRLPVGNVIRCDFANGRDLLGGLG